MASEPPLGSPTPLCQAGGDRLPRLTLGPPPWLRGRAAPWLPHPAGRARGRLQTRAGGSAGGAKRKPPALVNRLLKRLALQQLQPLHRIGSSLALSDTLSASSSRCTTSSLRIRSSRAWLAVRQSGSLTA